MKRSYLRELLVGLGVENPSGAFIDTIMDAFKEEEEQLKADYEKKLKEANDKTSEIETKFNELSANQVSKEDYENAIKENESFKAQIKRSSREKILKKYGGDEDFFDSVIPKIQEGKDDEEFEANVKAFYENESNAKYLSRQTKVVDTGGTGGRAPKPEETLESAIDAYYSQK